MSETTRFTSSQNQTIHKRKTSAAPKADATRPPGKLVYHLSVGHNPQGPEVCPLLERLSPVGRVERKKNVYAISYGNNYNLVTSIDYARKIGMRSGVVGKSAPKFEEDQHGTPTACTVTIHRKLPGSNTIGDFTETVYMAEYSTGRNLWATKPRTMLAKVAEMHALRMACPEELSQSYVEEEMEREHKEGQVLRPTVDLKACEQKLKDAKSLDELKAVWAALPAEAKAAPNIVDLKEGLKKQYEGSNV